MYKVIGADGNEYGPVSADQIRQWIAEHRLIAQSKVQAEGTTEWRALCEFPEFADVLTAQAQAPPPPGPTVGPLSAEFFERDYKLDIGACINGGFELLKNNFALLVCAFLIYLAIEIGLGLVSEIPYVGIVITLGSLIFVDGPLLGGVGYVFIKAIRRHPTSASEVFAGFGPRYWQLCLGYIVPSILIGMCLMPVVIVALFVFMPFEARNQEPGLVHIVMFVGTILVCLIPMIYLSVNWLFTLPLVIDRQLDFWSAMKASWKMVTKHWWHVFALSLLTWLIVIAGVLLCCVGVLVTAPIAIGAWLHAYETIFNPATAQAQST